MSAAAPAHAFLADAGVDRGLDPPVQVDSGPAGSSAVSKRAQQSQRILVRAQSASTPQERQELLGRAVMLNMPVARAVARRYYHRGLSSDDLDQVAYLSLVTAAHRFDPTQGTDFLAFAVPTIRGEIRRHFRDRGWTVRPPRRIQDTQRLVNVEAARLAQSLGRSPTTSELAEHVGLPEDDVLEALAANSCFSPTSLDRPVSHAGEECHLVDLLLDTTDHEGQAEARVLLYEVLRTLPDRDRWIIGLRFYDDLT